MNFTINMQGFCLSEGLCYFDRRALMERIREAIELARTKGTSVGGLERANRRHLPLHSTADTYDLPNLPMQRVDERILENMRVVAHRAANPMTPAFDILRTSVLQLMETNSWQTLAITSPTPGCGKTVTAINLALSIARIPNKQVVLLDLDMRRPLISSYLGFEPRGGLFELLNGELPDEACMTRLDISGTQLTIVPNRVPVANPAEVISSVEMVCLLQRLRSSRGNPVIIMDTPPMLVCDDVLALLPIIDCVALSVAEKMSRAEEVIACERHLKSVNYLGLVLTKSHELQEHTYY
jgi:protein-tyrosine kinase